MSNRGIMMAASGTAAAGGAGAYTTGYPFIWGKGGIGKIGDGANTSRSSPVLLDTQRWFSASSGSSAHGVKDDGTLWGWGAGGNGGIGDGVAVNRSSPVQIGTDTDWLVAGSNSHSNTSTTEAPNTSHFIKADGTMFKAGNPVGLPTQMTGSDWVQVSDGMLCATAVRSDGTLWGIGQGDHGRMFVGEGNKSTWTQEPYGLTNWVKCSSGYDFSFALRDDGTLWGCGSVENGRLENGWSSGASRSSPVQVGGAEWIDFSCGVFTTLAIKDDGTMWGWGQDTHGALGNGSPGNRTTRTQVGSDTDWAQIECAGRSSFGIKTDGTLWSWGDGELGVTGQNHENDTATPAQIGSETDWIKVGEMGLGGTIIAFRDSM